MMLDDFTTALKLAFNQCDEAGVPLTEPQKQILLDILQRVAVGQSASATNGESDRTNPLDDLTPEQRQRFLQYIQEQEQDNQPWKAKLLNDWVQGIDSGAIQFIRDQYGLQWLEQIQPVHIAQYQEARSRRLQVGDRVEVSNNLWEWVQEDGPCSREWFPCTVIRLVDARDDDSSSLPASYQHHTTCLIRFDNGMEYEIQGVYEWNRYNWRYLGTMEAGGI